MSPATSRRPISLVEPAGTPVISDEAARKAIESVQAAAAAAMASAAARAPPTSASAEPATAARYSNGSVPDYGPDYYDGYDLPLEMYSGDEDEAVNNHNFASTTPRLGMAAAGGCAGEDAWWYLLCSLLYFCFLCIYFIARPQSQEARAEARAAAAQVCWLAANQYIGGYRRWSAFALSRPSLRSH